ncbi:hypothetical protein MBCUT_04310 [Methanobrevibacter cuticularis]|uniref:DUF1890 domain-containing protein n=1 Tax=Methanobrevibacter cuticularis TaxID=47311 RepID=A0A166EUJ2_9EURY|nr:DUF1890 domain-containing protein [Methanobrevibacter cuticularis]KZX17025.1 hypothetical protein MBCUT_04310 [Methanobrevibacter cuticularis]
MKKALLLLGCPESPSQTPMAIYASSKLSQLDYEITIASTPAASKLLEVSDPNGYYVKDKIDIDSCLSTLEEKQYDLLLGFVSKDAAASYFVTFYHILQTESIALIFEKDPDVLEDLTKTVEENTEGKIVSVKAFHNPNPIKVRFDKILAELK